MTPHSVGRCPKDRGDRRPLGEPFFKRAFLNNYAYIASVRASPLGQLFIMVLYNRVDSDDTDR